MARLIESVSLAVSGALKEVITLGRTLKKRSADIVAYFDRPGTSNGPTEAINGRLEHLRGFALGFRNLTNYIARSLLEAGGFRLQLNPRSRRAGSPRSVPGGMGTPVGLVVMSAAVSRRTRRSGGAGRRQERDRAQVLLDSLDAGWRGTIEADHSDEIAACKVFATRQGIRREGPPVTTTRIFAALGEQAPRGVLGEGRGEPMLTEDRLVVADAYLDQARLHLDTVDPTLTTPSAAGDEALDRFSASQQLRPASVSLERARTYLRAAQQTIGDVADDVARGFVARAGEDLRLLERLCAMVDELSGQAARNLAAASRDRALPEELGRGLSADLSSIGQVRSSAQAAGRLAAELAADQRRAPLVTAERVAQRLRAEQQGRRPASSPAGAIGVPR